MGGGDKALLKIGGRPILDHVIARIGPQVRAVLLNANGDQGRFAAFGLPIITDSVAGFAGPLAGILAGLDWCAGNGIEWMVSVPADTPFLPSDLAARLWTACRGSDISCAGSGGRVHPVVALWPTSLAGDLRHALTVENTHKVDAWASRYRLGIAEWPAQPYDPFFNINRPADLAEAERIVSEFNP